MFFGGKDLILFEGVVEDRDDPLRMGRVRVRAHGFDDKSKELMPTDTLPWAFPILPPDDGRNVVGYKLGDIVCGYFRDGEAKQYRVILGKLSGIPEVKADPTVGLNDPTPDEDLVPGKVARPQQMIPPAAIEQLPGEQAPPEGKYDNPNQLPIQATSTGQLDKDFGKAPFPYDVNGDGKYDSADASLIIDPNQNGIVGAGADEGDFFNSEGGTISQVPISRYPLEDQLKESLASRLARNEKIDQTIVAIKKGNLMTAATANHGGLGVGSDEPFDGEAFGEPETPYNAKYPYNHVFESEAGHVFETDDTPLVERLHKYHRSGTFEEDHPDGKQVNKTVNDRYELTQGNANYAAKKDLNLTGTENTRLLAGKVMNIEAGGDLNQDSGRDRNVGVGRNANTRVGRSVYTVVERDVRILIKGSLFVAVEGDIKIKAKGDLLEDAKNIKIHAKEQNVLAGDEAVITEGALTYTNTPITDGIFIHAKAADSALVAETLGAALPIPPITPPPDFDKENDADNKDDLVTASDPHEGYILNSGSLIQGAVVPNDLYKPASDSDGKVVVLTKTLGTPAKLYEALPTGELQSVTIQYKHKDGTITSWPVMRPVHKKGRFIETGKYTGNGNGGRDTWRFSKPGSKYPTPMILQIGSTQYLIVEAITRHQAF